MIIRTIKKLKSTGGLGLVALAFAMTYAAGTKPDTPPVVTEEGIRITKLDVGTGEGGLSLKWETTDERIVEGDTYIIKCRNRQIPSRTGWSAWREIGRTTGKEFSTGGFWRGSDIMIRVEVDKGAIE